MRLEKLSDTIVAVATPMARSALGIVRLSGPKALEIASSVSFKPDGRPRNFTRLKPSRVYRALVGRSPEELIDDCLVILMKSPKSYTGEDTVEFICHGNPLILSKLQELLIERGARLAEPGEFTLRAMVNGKLSFSQAIAVADLIDSPTLLGVRSSVNRLRSGSESELSYIRSRLLYWTAWFEAWLDFPEEDVPEPQLEKFTDELSSLIAQIQRILKASEIGELIREGVPTLIIGKPNSGKSTLFNALLGEDRAITSSIPGTTRDLLSEYVNVLGIPLKIFDTAGLRQTEDPLELEGQRRIKRYLSRAKLVLWVLDLQELSLLISDRGLSSEGIYQTLLDESSWREELAPGTYVIGILNKADLLEEIPEAILSAMDRLRDEGILNRYLTISALKKAGLENLLKTIKDTILPEDRLLDEAAYTTSKAREKLMRAMESLIETKEALNQGLEIELVAFRLRRAMNFIGELTGEDVSESILDEVFSRFCIGK